MIPFHSLHVTLKQDYLHFIQFHSFPCLYFKTFNQSYLIPFHSILLHSFPLLKYISFHSFMDSQMKPQSFLVVKHSNPHTKIKFNPTNSPLTPTSEPLQRTQQHHRKLQQPTTPSNPVKACQSQWWSLNPDLGKYKPISKRERK